MRHARMPTILAVSAFAALLASSCAGEKTEPRTEPSLRALTAREGSPSPAIPPAGAPAEADASLPPGHPPVAAGGAADGAGAGAAASEGSIAGSITLAPSLKGRPLGNVLFVIVRSSADKKIVAVRREEGVTFPFKFQVSGTDAMIAGTPFTGPFDLTARLSKSGDAVAAKGDVEGFARGIKTGAHDVKVALDTVRE